MDTLIRHSLTPALESEEEGVAISETDPRGKGLAIFQGSEVLVLVMAELWILNMKKNDLERHGELNQTPQHIMVLDTNGQALRALKSDAKLLVLCWFVFLEQIGR